ncbi:MAG: thioesterase family protein [Acidobacteriota bacterium]
MSREDYTYWVEIDVRWGDMDSQGHVNNAVYFTYCESARVELLGKLGIRGKSGGRFGPALVSTTCNFRRQVIYPSRLDVGVSVEAIGGRSFTMKYGLFLHETSELVADASSVNAWVDYEEGRSVPLSDEMRDALADYMLLQID